MDAEFITPDECNYHFGLEGEKLMINVGSVGQPCDGDPRACYVIMDDKKSEIEFRRLEYDFATTIRTL